MKAGPPILSHGLRDPLDLGVSVSGDKKTRQKDRWDKKVPEFPEPQHRGQRQLNEEGRMGPGFPERANDILRPLEHN